MFSLGKSMRNRREYTDLCDTTKPLELKTIERTILRNFDSICVLLNKPEFKSHRQPNVLATLPKLAKLLRDIWNEAESDSEASDLTCLAYWRIVLRTLADQSFELMSLVRDHPKDIDKGNTQASQLYFQWSLSLFCIQLELEAMFPGNKYTDYKISSSEAAADWWQRQFGRSDTVTWHDFQFALSKRFRIKSLAEANKLKRDVNVTGSDHVSAYEFDVFARLFAPWSDQAIDLWRTITKDHPAFVRLRFKEVKSLLKDQRPSSYLFRRSTNTPSVWSIGYMNETGGVTQILVKPDKTIVEALTECADSRLLLYPAGKDSCHAPCLDAFLQEKQQPQQEQQEQKQEEEKNATDAKPPAEEIYVVAPEMQCSLCSRRSDEVSSMEACEHILCDCCFERHVQPRLYENWSMQTSRADFRLFCPVCRAEETAKADTASGSSLVKEVDLISLDDSEVHAAAADAAHDAASAASPEAHRAYLADFNPMSASEAADAERRAADACAGPEYATVIKAPKRDPLPQDVADSKQTNPFLCEYALLSCSTAPQQQQQQPSQQQQKTPQQQQKPSQQQQQPPQQQQKGGYLFYGSDEDVQRLLRQIPGLRYVPLPTAPSGELESPYSQIWDGKSG